MRKGIAAVLACIATSFGIFGCGSAVSSKGGSAPSGSATDGSGEPVGEEEASKYPEPLDAQGEGDLESNEPGVLEDALFDAANASRKRQGLLPLARARDLDEVARKYSRELAGRPGKISHDSPISGSPGDRVRAAGISFVRLTENLAKAPNAAAAHEGLMNSPGHRANILDGDVDEMGVGVVIVEEDGALGLVATQLFSSRPVKVNPKKAADGLAKRINALRKAAGLGPLKRHAWLDERARRAIEGCFEDRPAPSVGLGRDAPVSSARTLGFLVGEISQIDEMIDDGLPGAMEPEQNMFGIAVAQGTHVTHGKDIICVRIVVGAK